GRSLRRPDKQQERERAGPQEETVVPGRERPAAEQPRRENFPAAWIRATQEERHRSERDREEEHVGPDLVRIDQEAVVAEQEQDARQRDAGTEQASVDAVEERGGRHGGEEPENLRRAEGIESQEGHERDRGRVTPALRVVVIDVDPTLEEIACRGAVLPVEVGLDAVISDAVYDERLDAP